MSRIVSEQCLTDAVLQDLLADRLTGLSEAEARQHLNDCASCCQHMEDVLSTLDESLPALSAIKATDVQPWMQSILRSVADRPNSRLPEETDSELSAEAMVFPQRSANRLHCGRLDEFEIVRHVASGATGHLYRAHDTKLNRTVAIKVLRAELCVSIPSRQRFLQEANAIARIESDYIVAVYDIRERNDFPPYLVMEFIDGPSLQEELETESRILQPAAVKLMCEVLDGLTAAHARGVVHRDVKPGNILLQRHQEGQRAKLVDFGLARLDEQSFDLTSPGSIAGTPVYMAPEQVLDARLANEQSDVYSAGAVLYELLTGEVPFRGSVRMVLHQVLHEEPRSLRSVDDEVPRDLQTICLKAMSKSPAQRYATATAFREDLQRWANGLPVLARPVGVVGRFLRWKARNPMIANLFLVIASLLAVLMVMWGRFTFDTTTLLEELEIRNRDLRDSNRQLKAANERSDTDRSIAVGQAERANRQANLAFRVLNRLTFGLQNALSDRPKLQQQLLKASIDDLQQLSTEVAVDSPVSVTLTVAWLRLAEATRRNGDIASAADCFEKARRTLDAMSTEFQSEPDVQQCRIWLHLGQGEIAVHKTDFRNACTEFRAAVKLCRQLETSVPDRIATMHSHALANIRLSEVNCEATAPGAGTLPELLTEAVQLLNQCVALDAEAEDIRSDLAAARLKRARSMGPSELPAAIDETFAAIEQFLAIAADSTLRVQATQDAIEALTFITSRSENSPTQDRDVRIRQAKERIHVAINQLQTENHISATTGESWRKQLPSE
ncbi:MAG: serine/threonine-protein kinase [Planctomycetaceae bacterium]